MNKKADLAVFIGRFQPIHRGHLYAIRKGLEMAHRVLVIIGDTGGPRTIKNPWTFEERRQMLFESAPGQIVVRQAIDHPYTEQEWVTQIQSIVSVESHASDQIIIIGHEKDQSSYYLRMFPQWRFHDTGYETLSNGVIGHFDATAIRKMYYEDILQYASGIVPKSVMALILNMRDRDISTYNDLVQEYKFIQEYRKSWEAAPFPPVFVTTDCVVVQSGHVLLVERGQNPGKGLMALPGGFIDQSEGIEDCAIRELIEETSIKLQPEVLRRCISHVQVFDRRGGVSQEDRGRIITHVHLIKLDDHKNLPRVRGADDAADARWIPFAEIDQRKMFSDHGSILEAMLRKL